MKCIVLSCAILSTTLALAVPAQATFLTRTFVSSAGNDANPCTITQPCASFAHAYSLTAANGIIAALDPGKYGPLTIGGPITINGNGWAAITAPAAGNGITINSSIGDDVILIGLEIDGAGAGYNGILLNSPGNLTVTDCTLKNFIFNGSSNNTGNGILMQPTSGITRFMITNSTASNSGNWGIVYSPPSGSPLAEGVLDHVIASANTEGGIEVDTLSTTGGSTNVTISNSIASNNASLGILIDSVPGPSLLVSIDNVSVSGNSTGVVGTNSAKVCWPLGHHGQQHRRTKRYFFTIPSSPIRTTGLARIQAAPT